MCSKCEDSVNVISVYIIMTKKLVFVGAVIKKLQKSSVTLRCFAQKIFSNHEEVVQASGPAFWVSV